MKKVKFNVMAVAAMAIAFSTFAFKASEVKMADLYWFEIADGYAPSSKVNPMDATILDHIGPNPPPSIDCLGGSDQCISGFEASQVLSDQLDGDQKPVNTSLRQP